MIAIIIITSAVIIIVIITVIIITKIITSEGQVIIPTKYKVKIFFLMNCRFGYVY